MKTSFNLWTDPWILVRQSRGQGNGDILAVSMKDCFARAHELEAIAGELPTQDAAIFRLLLAVMHRALPITDRRPGRQWRAWWDAPALPVEAIEGYLSQHLNRFDLLHSETPFAQVANLKGSKTSGLVKLLADVPDGERYFTTRAGRHTGAVSVGEAARWLVHTQTFDPSGIKTGAVGDPRVKGGRGYPIGTGWSGQCGLVLAEGATLKESLLLSFTRNLHEADDTPWWERPPLTAAPCTGHDQPSGPADIMTWPARRIRLVVEEAPSGTEPPERKVVDVLLCNGDAIHPRNRQRLEPHCAWRYSEPQTKKHGHAVYMPRTHDPDRAFWRGLPSVLARGAARDGAASDAAPAMEPNVVAWLASLVLDGYLDPTHPVHFRAIGVTYGPQSSTFAAVVDDHLRFQAALLAESHLRLAAVQAVEAADLAVRAIYHLDVNLAKAGGRHDGADATDVGERVFASLDPLYRRWVVSLGQSADPEERLRAWHTAAYDVVRSAGAALVEAAGEAAWRGREVKRGGAAGGLAFLDSSLAFTYFTAALRKALPAAQQVTELAGRPASRQLRGNEESV